LSTDNQEVSAALAGRYGFPKTARLRSGREFEAVFAARERMTVWPLRVWALRRPGAAESRLGLAVSRKTGGAVRRNRLKRLVREAFRLNRERLAAPHDLVISIARGGERATSAEVTAAMREVLARLGERGEGSR
jgi:ribonuclease P protein component